MNGLKTGPNALLKVMAGDIINATTQYYYQNAVVNQTGNQLTNNVLNALLGAISSSTSSITKGATATISTNLDATLPFINAVAPDINNSSGNNPKAYLTILFFDERFNFVSEGSTYQRVTEGSSNNAILTLLNNKAPKKVMRLSM